MRAALTRLLVGLIVVAALVVTPPARAAMYVYDDAALATHPLVMLVTAATTDQSSIAFSSNGTTSLIVLLKVTTCAACSLLLRLQVEDPQAPGSWYTVGGASVAIAAVSNATYVFAPGFLAGGYPTFGTNIILPPRWRIYITHGNAVASTYNVVAFSY